MTELESFFAQTDADLNALFQRRRPIAVIEDIGPSHFSVIMDAGKTTEKPVRGPAAIRTAFKPWKAETKAANVRLTSTRANTVYGIYATRAGVEMAVYHLKTDGFRNTDISVLFLHNVDNKALGVHKAPKGTGATSGAVIGGALGWLAGIGALAIPGIGGFIAAGPIMAALAGAGVGGTVDGIVGGLICLGLPEYEAKHYASRIEKGGILLSVHSDNPDWTRRAKEILNNSGAEDICPSSEASADFEQVKKPRTRLNV